MDQLHMNFPTYHFEKNAGYGTAEHVEGPTDTWTL